MAKRRICSFVHNILPVTMAGLLLSGTAIAAQPDATNALPKSPNPTATVTPVCHKLHEKDYSQAFHASCYSEINKSVVVLVSGNAGKISGKQIADHILGQFEEAHVPAAAFLRFEERDKVAIVFLLNGDAYGPYSGHNWQDGFEAVKTHAPQAWFP